MSIRGLFTPITKIRRQVFEEVAKFAYERDLESNDFNYFYESPYRIIPGEVAQYRDSVFKERTIIRERIRLAMGLKLRPTVSYQNMTDGMKEGATSKKQLELPLVNVIPFACEACKVDHFKVTDNCRKCLAHPCTSVCPVNAVSIGKNAAIIDNDKCIKCGRCKEACPYNAIVRTGRPCAEACGANAIESDDLGRAKINQDKCVACGLCIVSCPFAAIADKSEILQLITAIRTGEKIYAIIAPSFVGQFGPLATPGKIVSGLRELGMDIVMEVSYGADFGSIQEAEEFMEHVPNEKPFLGTSCCPAWASFAAKTLPAHADCISGSNTPMVAAAKKIKQHDPSARVVFIGPCIAKKIEATYDDVSPFVDYVITYEELMGIFSAKGVELTELEESEFDVEASTDGRNYAVTGGVANAVINCIKNRDPEREVPYMKAETLAECRKMLMLAKAGKTKGHLLEGMACFGGCVGGPGTLSAIPRASKDVNTFANSSHFKTADDNIYVNKK